MSAQTAASYLKRDFAVYLPNIWPDNVFSHHSEFQTTEESSIQQQHDRFKQEIRRMLLNNTCEASMKLRLIDLVQRLGIAYHFSAEISDELDKISHLNLNDLSNNLHDTALGFRLLRQQGIKASSDVFEKFKDHEGKFKESLVNDVEGMLSLYEAAFLSIRGEDILDEAIAFTTTNLQLMLPKLSSNLVQKISHALNRPLRKNLPRLEARYFIPIYEEDESCDRTLLNFAKLDFNMLQEQHRKELNEIIRWWRNLDFKTKLPYARDRIVECYFWIMGAYFEPQYRLGRKMLTKVIAVTSVIDDTYDNFATTQELELFTEVIQRWDVGAVDSLPEYMKLIFQSVNEVYNEIEEITTNEGRPFCVYYAKESMKKVARYYLVEAKWRDKKYTPTMEEYLEVSLVTTSYQLLIIHSFIGMGEIATKEAFEWVSADPPIIKASTVVCRLMDDVVSHQFEQKRDHVASGVECYMEQYKVTKEEATEVFEKKTAEAWKDLNKECLKPLPISMVLLERILNMTRVMDVMYKYEDGYTNCHLLKDVVASMLRDPVL